MNPESRHNPKITLDFKLSGTKYYNTMWFELWFSCEKRVELLSHEMRFKWDMSDRVTFCQAVPSSMSGDSLLSAVCLGIGGEILNWKSTRGFVEHHLHHEETVSWQLFLVPQHFKWVKMPGKGCEIYEIITFILIGVTLQAFVVLILSPFFGESLIN